MDMSRRRPRPPPLNLTPSANPPILRPSRLKLPEGRWVVDGDGNQYFEPAKKRTLLLPEEADEMRVTPLDRFRYSVRAWLSKKITHSHRQEIEDCVDADPAAHIDPLEYFETMMAREEKNTPSKNHYRYSVFLSWLDHHCRDEGPLIMKIIHEKEEEEGIIPSILKLCTMVISCIVALV